MGRALLLACWIALIEATAAAVSHPASPRGIATWICAGLFLVAFTLAVVRSQAIWTQPPSVPALPPPLVRLYDLAADAALHRIDPAVLLLTGGVAAVAMQFLTASNGAFVAVIATIVVAGIRLEATPSRVIAGITGVGFLVASGVSLSAGVVVSAAPGLLFAYLGSRAVRRLRVEQWRTQELLEEVVAGRDARIRAAALDERARLAREMHDVLAHTLSALSIQLEGTRMLAEQQPGDPAVATALERASGLAREGLAEARRAVGSLRGDTLPGPDLLPQLASDFERDTGVPCHLQVEGQGIDLSADARLAIYRVAQEALTNVRKYAEASAVEIALRYAPQGVELIVENDGEPRASPIKGGGFGLRGMRERAELLDGSLEAGPTANGYRVRLWIPTATSVQSAS